LIALALLTQMSMPPNFSIVSADGVGDDCSSRMSPTIGSAWPPAASISRRCCVDRPVELSDAARPVLATSAMLAPSAALQRDRKSDAAARPEMNIVRPCSVWLMN